MLHLLQGLYGKEDPAWKCLSPSKHLQAHGELVQHTLPQPSLWDSDSTACYDILP